MQRPILICVSLFLYFGYAPWAFGNESHGNAPTVVLANDGQAMQPIVVSPDASEATRVAADEMAEYLGKISGAEFDVREGDGAAGIAVGVAGDFPKLNVEGLFAREDPLRRDEYLLRTHKDGVHVIGAGETGVVHAVWDLLHRLGYRLFFPADNWEIMPHRSWLALAVDTIQRPDFVTRRAPRGAPWSDNVLWERWRRRNRVTSSFQLNTGHAYGRVVGAKRAEFSAHPEYFALIDGRRRTPDLAGASIKFCISNPHLRQLVADYAVETIKADPARTSLSLDPSDGGGWCECDECRAMGSVSDRVVTLASQAAEAINSLGLGRKYVGIYAYNQHSPPPNIQVHPQVIVSIATSFIRGGYTLEELIEGWRAKGATLGIRDYHDVFTWSHDQPRKARGGDIDYLCRTTSYFHQHGARFMNSENSDSWGANGLGYWLTPRLLWDVDNVDRVDVLIDDFLQKAFQSAEPPMREFYDLLGRDRMPRSSEDLLARMYRCLDEARGLTDDEGVHRRLEDLILYTRYLELYHAYRRAKGPERQEGFELVWRHAYRMRDRMIVSSRAICDRDRFRDKAVTVPENASWKVPASDNPWKDDSPFDADEIASMLRAGMSANSPTKLDFEVAQYSEDLLPASELNLPPVEPGEHADQFRGRQVVFTWLPDNGSGAEASSQIRLTVTGGMIAHYRDRGNVRFALYALPEGGERQVDRDGSVPPDGEPRTISLSSPCTGLHRLEWTDGKDMTRVVWPDNVPRTFRSSLDAPLELRGSWSLYFYVPRGTRIVGGFATANTGRIRDGDGDLAYAFDQMEQAGYFRVVVPPGQDGSLWKFEDCSGSRTLMTTPPYLAPSERDLLLPREVVIADRPPRLR